MKRLFYPWAGIDFMVQDRKPYLIECNGSPYAIEEGEHLWDNEIPFEMLCRYMTSFGNRIMILINPRLFRTTWLQSKLLYYLHKSRKKLHIHLCDTQKNTKRIKKGTIPADIDGKMARPDFIFKSSIRTGIRYEQAGIAVANSKLANTICDNKFLTYEIIRRYAKGIRQAETFFARDKRELVKILKENKKLFRKGFVLKHEGEKPEYSFGGFGVMVFKKFLVPKKTPLYPLVVQERLIPSGKYYFDIRYVLTLNRYGVGIKRVSRTPVTNLSQSGWAAKLDKKLERRINPLAVKCARVVEKACKPFDINRLNDTNIRKTIWDYYIG
jgi:glutathione synthase/RimK-type ligase-like ATP-grasp enzyme